MQLKSVDQDFSIQGPREFPLSLNINDLSELTNRAYRWHWHKELQLCYVTKGQVTFHVGKARHNIGAGEGIFINKECIHTSRSLSVPPGVYTCINIDPKMLRMFSGSVIEQKYLNPYFHDSSLEAIEFSPSIEWHQNVLCNMKSLYTLLKQKTKGYEIAACIHLYGIFYSIVCNLNQTEWKNPPRKDRQQLRDMIDYINGHYCEKITLHDISAEVHLSPNECCRIFKRSLGTTIMGYVLECRIDKSLDLLLTTDETISNIAYECGFPSSSYFTKHFHQRMGVTPNKYRKGS